MKVIEFSIDKNKAIFVAATTVLLVAIVVALISVVSDVRTSKLVRDVEAARSRAETLEKDAANRETEAARYRGKIEYLEKNIAEIQNIARKQDEELEIYNRDVSAARGRYADAKRVRSISATADELCTKLAELDHPCE